MTLDYELDARPQRRSVESHLDSIAGMERFMSADPLYPQPRPRPLGFYVTARCGFALILLAVVLSAAVGLLFHFFIARQLQTLWSDGEVSVYNTAENYVGHNACNCSASAAPMSVSQHFDGEDAARESQTPDAPEYRLPANLAPYHYVVELRPDIYKPDPDDFEFNGTVTIKFTCLQSTSIVTLHKMLYIKLLTYEIRHAEEAADSPRRSLAIVGHAYNQMNSFLKFNISEPLVASQNYTLVISFQSPMRADNTGIFYSSYQAEDATEKYIVASQMQATDARKAFPCFDEPALKAVFVVKLWRKDHMTALSNMPLQKSVNMSDNWIVDTFHDTPPMSTYLLAVIVCDYVHAQVTVGRGNTTVRVWAPEGLIEQASYILNAAARITEYFEMLLDETSPLPKQDMIIVYGLPFFGMENWGLITYNKPAFFYHANTSLARSKQLVATVAAHEIAHQWFGNLVSPSWWSELLLSEGVTTYMQYGGMDHIDETWEMTSQCLFDAFYAKRIDSRLSSNPHPLRAQLRYPFEISRAFDGITYNKGASIIRQAHFVLGDEVFIAGLKKYLRRWRYKSASEEQLWEAWQEESTRRGIHLNVSSVMATWTNQLGFPLISLSYERPRTFKVTQELFLLSQHSGTEDLPASPYSYKWYVPLTVVTDLRPQFNLTNRDVIWMTKDENIKEVRIDYSKWFVLNAGSYGFYRVNYENVIWDALAEQLLLDHQVIPENNRAQLIDDAFQLVEANYLGIEKALAITRYLKRETKYIPLSVGLKFMNEIGDRLRTTLIYGQYEIYMKAMLADHYQRLGGFYLNSNSHLSKLASKEVISSACMYDASDCRNTARSIFSNWMDGRAEVPIELASVVFCYGVRQGGRAEWEKVFETYESSKVDFFDANKLLAALACTQEPWLLNRLLDLAINRSNVDSTVSIIKNVAANPMGKQLAWNFVRSNFFTLYKMERDSENVHLATILLDVTQSFTTTQELKEVMELKEEYSYIIVSHQSDDFSEAEAGVRSNIDFMTRNERTISNWLSNL